MVSSQVRPAAWSMRRDGGRLLANRRLFAVADTGVPDGIKVDAEGNVWTGVGDGVACYSPGVGNLLCMFRFVRCWAGHACGAAGWALVRMHINC